MILTLNLDRGYLAPGHPAGEYRLWLWRDDRHDAALVVLTELPWDEGPGLLSRLGPIASEVARDHRLNPDATLWYVRAVLPDGREWIRAVELRRNGAAYFDPDLSVSTRAQIEILTQSPMPPVGRDEARQPKPKVNGSSKP